MAVRSVVVALRAEVSGYIAGMNAAAAATGKNKAAAQEVGKSLAVTGVILGGFVLASANAAAKFDQAMSKVNAATHASAQQMGVLRNAALDMSKGTVFSAVQAAGAIEELAKAGVSTSSILNGGLKGALNLAAAGELSVSEAAQTAASAMTQFGLSGDKVSHIADLLSAGAGKAQGSVHDLGAALGQVGLVASGTGLTIEETTGALAAFASAGLIGSDSGTSFKTMLQSLNPRSKEAAQLIDSLGISAYDSQGQFIGLSAYAGKLQGALKDMSQQQRAATLQTIFGTDAVRAARVLYTQGAAGIQTWIDKTNEAGYAATTAALRLDNWRGDVTKLGSALNRAFIATGEGAQGPLRGVTQNLTDLVDAYSALPAPAQQGAISVAAVGSAITLVAAGALFALPKIAATKVAIAELGLTAKGSALGLGAIGAVTVALGLGVEGWASYEAAAKKSSENVKLATTAAATGNLTQIKAAAAQLSEQVQAYNDLSDRLGHENLLQTALHPLRNLGFLGTDIDSVGSKLGALNIQISNARGNLLQYLRETTSPEVFSSLLSNTDALDAKLQGLSDTADKAGLNASGSYAALATGLDAARAASSTAAAAQGNLESALGSTAVSADEAAGSVKQLSDALDALIGRFVSQNSATASYEQALDDIGTKTKDAQKANKRWTDSLNLGTAVGRDNAAVIRDSVSALTDKINADKNAGVSNAQLSKTMRDGRSAILDAAEAAGLNRVAVGKMLDKLGLTEKVWKAAVVVTGVEKASLAIDGIHQKLAGLRDKSISVQIAQSVTGGTGGAIFPAKKAAGGFISGPGSSTSDSVPALLSNGEFVMNAASTSRNRALLEAMNVQRFAAGGAVGRASSNGRLGDTVAAGLMSGASVEAVQAAIKAATQLQALWQASLDRAAQVQARADLVAAREKALAEQVKAAKTKDKKDDITAREAVKSANKDLAAFDKQAAETAKQKRFDNQQAKLAAAEVAAQARQTLKDNEAAFNFDHESAADQLKDLDKRIAGEKKFSDAWVADTNRREQIQKSLDDAQTQADQQHAQDLQKAVDLANGDYASALNTLNSLLDDQAKLQQQITDAQTAYTAAVNDADAALTKQVESIKTARAEALAGWADITQKSVVAAAPSANTLIKNAQGQIDQFREWQQRVGTARAQGISEAVIATLGLDAGPQALGQLRKLNAATGEQVAQLNALVDTRKALAVGQTSTEAAAGTGQVGKDIQTAQAEATAAKDAAKNTLDAATAQVGGQLQDLGVSHGRTYADAIAQGLQSGLPGLTTAVQTLQGAFTTLSGAQAAQSAFAGGGLVTGPGSGTSDSISARLSNGEFVVNAVDAAKNRRLLETVNGGRYVSANRIASPSASVDTWRLETQVQRLTEATHEQTSVIRQGQAQPLLTPAGW